MTEGGRRCCKLAILADGQVQGQGDEAETLRVPSAATQRSGGEQDMARLRSKRGSTDAAPEEPVVLRGTAGTRCRPRSSTTSPGRASDHEAGRHARRARGITQEQLDEALDEASRGARPRLGEILVSTARAPRRRSSPRARRATRPAADRSSSPHPATRGAGALPRSARAPHRALPMAIDEDQLYVAIDGPISDAALAELRAAAGHEVLLVISPTERHRHGHRPRRTARSTASSSTRRNFDDEAALRLGTAPSASTQIDDNAPVVQVVQRIITQALRDRASDVHIEPQDDTGPRPLPHRRRAARRRRPARRRWPRRSSAASRSWPT